MEVPAGNSMEDSSIQVYKTVQILQTAAVVILLTAFPVVDPFVQYRYRQTVFPESDYQLNIRFQFQMSYKKYTNNIHN